MRTIRVRKHTRQRGAIQVRKHVRSLERRARSETDRAIVHKMPSALANRFAPQVATGDALGVEVKSRYKDLPRSRKLLTAAIGGELVGGLISMGLTQKVQSGAPATARDLQKFQKYIHKKKYFVFPTKYLRSKEAGSMSLGRSYKERIRRLSALKKESDVVLTPVQRKRFLKRELAILAGKEVGVAERAHELGHLETPKFATLFKLIIAGKGKAQMLPVGAASGIVLASDPESKKARIAPIASGIAETALVSPMLLSEVLASRRGLKLLKELGYSKRTRMRAAKTLAYALGTYLAYAAPKVALSYAVPESIRRVKLRLKKKAQAVSASEKDKPLQ